MPKEKKGQLVRSNDLGLVAALTCAGMEYSKVDREEGIAYFSFISSGKELEIMVEQYWSNKLMVSALAYHQSLRGIKNVIFNK